MQESKSQLEQCHPIPLSFEHVLNYYKHLMTGLQSVLQKPLEVRLKEGICKSAVNFASSWPPSKYSEVCNFLLLSKLSWRKQAFWVCVLFSDSTGVMLL